MWLISPRCLFKITLFLALASTLLIYSNVIYIMCFQTSVSQSGVRYECSNLENFDQDDPALVDCLKKNFLNPPSLLPYNLTNSEVKNPSQFGQTTLVLSLLGEKKNGFFIESGALDGEYLSNSLMLERFYGWSGLLIEPSHSSFQLLMTKNRKAWTSNTCLSVTPHAQNLTLFGGDEISAIKSIMNNSRKLPMFTNGKKPVEEVGVQCFPLYTYLLAINQTVIDYFSLDVEGADFQILKTIPFDKVTFRVMELEVAWLEDNDAREVLQFFEKRGYVFYKQIEGDAIFIHKSVAGTGG